MIINNSYEKIKTIDKFRELIGSNTKTLYVWGINSPIKSVGNDSFDKDMSDFNARDLMNTFDYYYKNKSKEVY